MQHQLRRVTYGATISVASAKSLALFAANCTISGRSAANVHQHATHMSTMNKYVIYTVFQKKHPLILLAIS